MPTLDLSPLEDALAALDRGLARAIPAPADEELRDACIQRFEFCFEMRWKMRKRRLEQDLPSRRPTLDLFFHRDAHGVSSSR